jgi:hypothetical protein
MNFCKSIVYLMTITNENMLINHGGLANNNLDIVIQEYVSDEQEGQTPPTSCSYYSHDDLLKSSKEDKGNNTFSLFSLNCQSIHAKFDSLLLLVSEFRVSDFEFGAICLQESWLPEDADLSML